MPMLRFLLNEAMSHQKNGGRRQAFGGA